MFAIDVFCITLAALTMLSAIKTAACKPLFSSSKEAKAFSPFTAFPMVFSCTAFFASATSSAVLTSSSAALSRSLTTLSEAPFTISAILSSLA